jgi:hypothetical protein
MEILSDFQILLKKSKKKKTFSTYAEYSFWIRTNDWRNFTYFCKDFISATNLFSFLLIASDCSQISIGDVKQCRCQGLLMIILNKK